MSTSVKRKDYEKLKKLSLSKEDIKYIVEAGHIPKNYLAIYRNHTIEEFPEISKQNGVIYYKDCGAFDESRSFTVNSMFIFVYPQVLVIADMYYYKQDALYGNNRIEYSFDSHYVVPITSLRAYQSGKIIKTSPIGIETPGDPTLGAVIGGAIGGATGAIIGATVFSKPNVKYYGGQNLYLSELKFDFIHGPKFEVTHTNFSHLEKHMQYGDFRSIIDILKKSPIDFNVRKELKKKMKKIDSRFADLNWYMNDDELFNHINHILKDISTENDKYKLKELVPYLINLRTKAVAEKKQLEQKIDELNMQTNKFFLFSNKKKQIRENINDLNNKIYDLYIPKVDDLYLNMEEQKTIIEIEDTEPSKYGVVDPDTEETRYFIPAGKYKVKSNGDDDSLYIVEKELTRLSDDPNESGYYDVDYKYIKTINFTNKKQATITIAEDQCILVLGHLTFENVQ